MLIKPGSLFHETLERRPSFASAVSLAADPEVELVDISETDAAGRLMTEIARDALEEG